MLGYSLLLISQTPPGAGASIALRETTSRGFSKDQAGPPPRFINKDILETFPLTENENPLYLLSIAFNSFALVGRYSLLHLHSMRT